MNIDSQMPHHQLVFTPVRPDPVKPGQDTVRPVPTPNGAEAGARNPLQDNQRGQEASTDARNRAVSGQEDGRRASSRTGGEPELNEAQKRELEQLKARDREVRAHEAAHKSAAGQFARGGAQFEYQTGPDGSRYAVGGEVSIDIARTGDPEKDIAKAQTIRDAALAPATPSAQDRRVAVEASAMEAAARAELREAERVEQAESTEGEGNTQALAANDAYNPEAPGREVPRAEPDRVGEFLDVFA